MLGMHSSIPAAHSPTSGLEACYSLHVLMSVDALIWTPGACAQVLQGGDVRGGDSAPPVVRGRVHRLRRVAGAAAEEARPHPGAPLAGCPLSLPPSNTGWLLQICFISSSTCGMLAYVPGMNGLLWGFKVCCLLSSRKSFLCVHAQGSNPHVGVP